MSKISSYKDLIVWQKSVELSVITYQITEKFPKSEIFGLSLQMRKAAVSIPSNIAEGNGRNKLNKEYAQFLHIALGSAQELETQFIIACRLGYVEEGEDLHYKASNLLVEVLKMLNSMTKKD